MLDPALTEEAVSIGWSRWRRPIEMEEKRLFEALCRQAAVGVPGARDHVQGR